MQGPGRSGAVAAGSLGEIGRRNAPGIAVSLARIERVAMKGMSGYLAFAFAAALVFSAALESRAAAPPPV
jgi:hypothetical protein